uniref:Dixin n=1 Tax=Mola mola TaxID=94237 RepID=A0A3Q3X1B2_MOLML
MIASLSRGSLLAEVLHGGLNEQQLAAYVSWVNAQLTRNPGLKPIADLRHDLRDGVVLTQLIEIVAGEVLEGVYVAPQNKEESRKNVEQVLQFISARHIRMPHISARDIVDGNLKSVMRIILALAAHFKPSANNKALSGRGQSLTRGCASHNPFSPVALAQGAAAALATARHDASHSEFKFSLIDTVNTVIFLMHPCLICLYSVLIVHYAHAHTTHIRQPTSLKWFKLASHVTLCVFKALLLDGSLPEDEQDVSLSLDQGNAEQQVVVIVSPYSLMLRCKQEMRNLQGIKDAQQQRLCTQEASILQMKQELLRASMTKEELINKNVRQSYTHGLIQKEVSQKDRLLQQLKHQLEESQNIQQTEEVQLLRDALRSLRNNLRDQDPQHHTLDTLEQGIVSLIDRLHVLHTYRGRGKSQRHKDQHTDSDTWPRTKVFPSHSDSPASTKILYFTGKSPTPSMINIPKRLGEVTLKDVKAAVDQEGSYRYHFKALDPEFGTVKEEVFLDGAIIPGWEGKIVAWVEEDHGEER